MPAAGEFFGVARPIFLAKPKAVKHSSNLRVERVAVFNAELAGDAFITVRDLRVLAGRVVELAHFVSEVFHLLLQRAQVGEDGHAFVENSAAGKLKAVLRQIAEGRVLGGDEATVVERLDPGKDFQQRGFSGAVGADKANALSGSDQPVKIFEEKFRAKAFAG